jgi:hypothetical protein
VPQRPTLTRRDLPQGGLSEPWEPMHPLQEHLEGDRSAPDAKIG